MGPRSRLGWWWEEKVRHRLLDLRDAVRRKLGLKRIPRHRFVRGKFATFVQRPL